MGHTQLSDSDRPRSPVVATRAAEQKWRRSCCLVTLNSDGVNHRGGSKRPKVRNLMARLILSSCLGLVLLGSASAIAEPSPGSDLSGVYACEGTNPDGSAYTAVVEIVKRQDTYRSEEHTSELQSQSNLVCRLLLE